MNLGQLLVTVHVLAAVVGFGVTFSYPVIQLLAERRAPRHLPFAFATILTISQKIAVPGAVLVGLTGLALALTGPYSLARDGWLLVSVPVYMAVFVTAVFVLTPDLRRAKAESERMVAQAGEDEPTTSAEYGRLETRLGLVGGLVGAGVITLVVLMSLKPFAG
jgi:hypothetical protein